MTPAESRDAFRRILARNPAGQLIVATGDINARFDQWVRRTGFQRTMTAASIPRAHVRPPSAGDMVPPATASERVLVDLWKELYVPCLERFYGKLASGAFVAGDNMLSPPMSRPEAEAYRARIRQLEFDTVLLPIGSGVELSRRR